MPAEVPTTGSRRRGVVVVVITGATLLAAGCGSVGYLDSSGSKTNGKKLFADRCGGCHVLADAGTKGTIGPDLDHAFLQYRTDAAGENPSADDLARAESTVRQVVRGQIAYPVVEPSTGAPGMPLPGGPNGTLPLCTDLPEDTKRACFASEDEQSQAADDIAAYVASTAGTGATAPSTPPPPPPADAGGSGSSPDAAGKQVFAEAGCGSCHTLGDAGSSGTIGPNLDDSKPDEALVVDRVTNGRGGMPAFADQLDAEQIGAVAAYVSSVAGS